MGARGLGRRVLVGLTVLTLLAGCGASATPTTKPATPTPAVTPATTPAPPPTPAVTAAPTSPTPAPAAGSPGSMVNARAYQTATLLPDGRVLLAGGVNLVVGSPTSLASAELYDPKTGLFSATGSLTGARSYDTATLLPDGRVLIAGGEGSVLIFASAELYNPKTGTFSPTGSMTTERDQDTATLLADGRVLITGGDDGLKVLASAEIYDPQTGKFTATGSMTTPRLLHSAILLPDGDVLIAGGCVSEDTCGTGTTVASAELYNPKTGKFSATGSMETPRGLPTLTLLPNGRVLVAGGCSGGGEGTLLAELYDPKTGTFTPTTGPMAVPRCTHTATLLPDGNVLIAGGDDGGYMRGNSLASAELYNPQTGRFSPTTSP